MRRAGVALVAVALAVVFGVVACGTTNEAPAVGEVKTVVNYVNLPDGRRLLCVFQSGYYKGGPSCDWQSAGGAR